MKISAAVATAPKQPLEVWEVELDDPRPDEVRVRMVASGVCHTDAAVRDGVIPTRLPVVLGHEGAGIVEAIGSSVVSVAIGDHVVLSANSCGYCLQCLSGRLAYCEDLYGRNFAARRADGSSSLTASGETVGSNFFGQSSFATYSNVAERSVVKVDSDIDLTTVAPFGCGIQTGAGAVLNELRPGPGSSIAVLGTGAVGMAAVLAARLTGATIIVAVDVIDSRLEIASKLGATATINSKAGDLTERLRDLTGGRGVDFVLDTTGIPAVLRQATDSLAIRGVLALVGSSAAGTEVHLEIGESLNRGWTFKTVIQGSSVPQTFIPALIDLWRQGRFPVDQIIQKYPAKEINAAFDASEHGTVLKPVIVY